MSILTPRKLACPACGVAREERIAESVNASRAPLLREAARAGTFQRYVCEGCGRRYEVDEPFTYIDFPRRLWLGVFPRAWESRWAELEHEPRRVWSRHLVEHAPPFMKPVAEGLRVRTVFGLDALREKILCLEAGVDDALLEALKLDLLRERGAMGDELRPRLSAVDDTTITLVYPNGEVEHLTRAALDARSTDAWLSLLATLVEGPYVDLGRLFGGG